MFRGDSASSSAAGQASVAPRGNAPDRPARVTANEPLLSRRKFGPQWAAALASAVLAGSGTYHGLNGIKAWVGRRQPFPVGVENVKILPDPPAWLIDARSKILDVMPELSRQTSLLAIDPDEMARRLRMKMPWIESVDRVVLRHPGSMELHVTFRKPLMELTLQKQGAYLLDRTGVVLPEKDVIKPFRESLIKFNYSDSLVQQVVARGGKSPAEIPAGKIWEDERVAECLQLAQFLTGRSRRGDNDKPLFWFIDAAHVQDRLIVRTVDGLWISWGRSPGRERPGEPDAETKWRLLLRWLETHRTENSADLKQSFLVFEKDRAYLSRGG